MSSRRRLVQINPSNQGNGVFSFRGGVNQLVFDIPMTPAILNGKSVRINGTFDTLLTPLTRPANNTAVDGVAAGVATGTDVFIDPRVGVSSCIDFLTIQNLEGATYEQIKSYNRLCASIIPLQEGIQSYLSGGIDIAYGALGKEQQQGLRCDNPFQFSIPLQAGFLQGNPIDLQLVRGLRITVTLASDLFVCGNNKWNNALSTGGTAGSGAYYQLRDVNMSYELEVPDADGQAAMVANTSGAWEYNAYSSFYQVVQSTDTNAVLNINKSRTLGTIMNMIPSKFINNYNYNSNWAVQPLEADATGELRNQCNLQELTFTKGGLRIPLDMEIRTEAEQAVGVATSFKNFEELNAVRNVWSMSSFLKSLRTELSLARNVAGVIQQPKYFDSMTSNDAKNAWNVGCSYDHITSNGLNFKNTPLGLRFQTKPTTGINLEPHSLYCFIRHKNTINFDNGQVSIQN
tara:strand:+ start:11500 stop:12876 length:1377 start_codon:yes stop_codon:yes gene_type:complete